tara:strand:- start:6445 stop:7374 length:930 start_codon:yes stop_codon:yes gene_type:complete
MINELLINLVDSTLGPGKRTARGNVAYHCPYCSHNKKKLEIKFTKSKKGYNPWHCWSCDTKGNHIKTIFKKIKVSPHIFTQLYKLVPNNKSYREDKVTYNTLSLPKEYKPFTNEPDLTSKHALAYLKLRNVTKHDILKHNIGYCGSGEYSNRIIIPSYNSEGELNYFTSRSFKKDEWLKYKNPEASRDIIPFEININWNLPIILCEGPFDALAIKRNVIPLFGKNIQSQLMMKIISSKVKKIYIVLDQDALKHALKHCETLINAGKEVYLVELPGKDPSDMGFRRFTKLIQDATPTDMYQLMEKQISLI